ncbi:MAG: 30S ribosomal protein S7 [Candidatus Woesearchaeota archaeon]
MVEIKLYNRWSTEGITISDEGLKGYITLAPIIVPRNNGRYAGFRFYKSKINIVERLMNKLMVAGHKGKEHTISSGHQTGKAQHVLKIMEQVLETIEKKTKQNPVEVLVQGVINAAPREEILTIEYGGARYPKAVDCAPQRRIDIALRYMVQGSHQKSFNHKKSIVDALSDEIIAASQLSQQSVAVSKKLELERQADSSR